MWLSPQRARVALQLTACRRKSIDIPLLFAIIKNCKIYDTEISADPGRRLPVALRATAKFPRYDIRIIAERSAAKRPQISTRYPKCAATPGIPSIRLSGRLRYCSWGRPYSPF